MPLSTAYPKLQADMATLAEAMRGNTMDIAEILQQLATAIHTYASQAQVAPGQSVSVAAGQLVVGVGGGVPGPVSGATTTPGTGTTITPGSLI